MNDQGRTIVHSPTKKELHDVFKRLERAHKALWYALKRVNEDPIRIEMIKHTHPKFKDLRSWHDVVLTYLDSADVTTYSMNRDAFFADVDKQADDCFMLAIEITRVLAPLDATLIS